MYLPESKYSKPKYTRGDELLKVDGTFYTGWYFSSYSGKFFTGKSPDNNTKPLFPANTEEQVDLRTGETPGKFSSDIIIPTEKDYQEGFFTRYFVQDKRNKAIIEVNFASRAKMLKLPYTKVQEVKWILKGPAEDIKHGPYIFFGAASQNKENIAQAEESIKGLTLFIKSYSEFVK